MNEEKSSTISSVSFAPLDLVIKKTVYTDGVEIKEILLLSHERKIYRLTGNPEGIQLSDDEANETFLQLRQAMQEEIRRAELMAPLPQMQGKGTIIPFGG